jgi:hypothetical protein
MYVVSQSTVCEWHQFQGLNEVIYSQYRQMFCACGWLKGNLITPSRTRPPSAPRVGARLVFIVCGTYPLALAALRMVWASAAWNLLDGGGDAGNVVREEAAGGRAALAVSRM